MPSIALFNYYKTLLNPVLNTSDTSTPVLERLDRICINSSSIFIANYQLGMDLLSKLLRNIL